MLTLNLLPRRTPQNGSPSFLEDPWKATKGIRHRREHQIAPVARRCRPPPQGLLPPQLPRPAALDRHALGVASFLLYPCSHCASGRPRPPAELTEPGGVGKGSRRSPGLLNSPPRSHCAGSSVFSQRPAMRIRVRSGRPRVPFILKDFDGSRPAPFPHVLTDHQVWPNSKQTFRHLLSATPPGGTLENPRPQVAPGTDPLSLVTCTPLTYLTSVTTTE